MKKLFLFILVLSISTVKSQAPFYKWGKGFGGTSPDEVYGLAYDTKGNIYVVGKMGSIADVDPGAAVYNASPGAFVNKLDAAGNFIWSKSIGGPASCSV